MEKWFEIRSQCVGTAALKIGDQADTGASNGPVANATGTGASNGPVTTATNGGKMIEGTERRLLNRVVRCTTDGWEVEPDQRHVDLIVSELALAGANGVTTPGENEPRPQEGEVDED